MDSPRFDERGAETVTGTTDDVQKKQPSEIPWETGYCRGVSRREFCDFRHSSALMDHRRVTSRFRGPLPEGTGAEIGITGRTTNGGGLDDGPRAGGGEGLGPRSQNGIHDVGPLRWSQRRRRMVLIILGWELDRTGGQSKDRVSIVHRVGRTNGSSQTIVRDGREFAAFRFGQSQVGGDDSNGGVERRYRLDRERPHVGGISLSITDRWGSKEVRRGEERVVPGKCGPGIDHRPHRVDHGHGGDDDRLGECGRIVSETVEFDTLTGHSDSTLQSSGAGADTSTMRAVGECCGNAGPSSKRGSASECVIGAMGNRPGAAEIENDRRWDDRDDEGSGSANGEPQSALFEDLHHSIGGGETEGTATGQTNGLHFLHQVFGS